MSAAALLDRAHADGVTLHLDTTGKLKATGDQTAVDRLLPEVRKHRPALIDLLSTPRRRWLLTEIDGERYEACMCPPATLTEVQEWHPGAHVEHIDDQVEAA